MGAIPEILRWVVLGGAMVVLAVFLAQIVGEVRAGTALTDALDSSWVESRHLPTACLLAVVGYLTSLVLAQDRPIGFEPELVFCAAAVVLGVQLYLLSSRLGARPLALVSFVLILPAAASFLVAYP